MAWSPPSTRGSPRRGRCRRRVSARSWSRLLTRPRRSGHRRMGGFKMRGSSRVSSGRGCRAGGAGRRGRGRAGRGPGGGAEDGALRQEPTPTMRTGRESERGGMMIPVGGGSPACWSQAGVSGPWFNQKRQFRTSGRVAHSPSGGASGRHHHQSAFRFSARFRRFEGRSVPPAGRPARRSSGAGGGFRRPAGRARRAGRRCGGGEVLVDQARQLGQGAGPVGGPMLLS